MATPDTLTRTEPGPVGVARPAAPAPAAGTRLAFNNVEESWQLDEPSGSAITIQLELRVSGSLDEGRLRGALQAAQAVHPMTRVRRVAGRRWLRPPVWEVGEPDAAGALRAGDFADDPALAAARDAFFGEPIPLGQSPPLRALLARRPGGDSLLLSFSHAVADGMGALRFLHSVARAYAGRPDPVPEIDPLSARDLKAFFGHDGSRPTPKVAPVPVPKGTRAFLAAEGGQAGHGQGFRLVDLPAEQVAGLDPRKLEPSATLNDLLIAAFHQAVARWNGDRGRPCDCVTVYMPVNQRAGDLRRELVVNLTGGGKVASTAAERSDDRALLSTVARQTRWVRDCVDAAAILDLPYWLLGISPYLFLAFLAVVGPKVSNTGVLSNLGRLDDPPDFGPEAGEVTGFWFSPPCGMPTGVVVGAAGLRGRLHLSVRYCRALFDEGAAGRFTDLFVESLLRLGHADRPERG